MNLVTTSESKGCSFHLLEDTKTSKAKKVLKKDMQVVISKKAEKSNVQATSNPIYISKIQVKMISNIIFFLWTGGSIISVIYK